MSLIEILQKKIFLTLGSMPVIQGKHECACHSEAEPKNLVRRKTIRFRDVSGIRPQHDFTGVFAKYQRTAFQ